MPKPAVLSQPAQREYRGSRTQPERWANWTPHQGDVIISTPAKCGTTWTQTILTMLLYGTVDLPDRVSALSPWVDSNLEDADRVSEVPLSPSGRRVVKTHTPTDGFPVWDGVRVVAVYRHPLDVFLSVRKHLINIKDFEPGVKCGPIPEALAHYTAEAFDPQNCDDDLMGSITEHYLHTVNRAHQTGLVLMHYADMFADHRGAVAHLAQALEIAADDALIDAIVDATQITAMRSNATQFAPEGGKGFWHDDTAFFSTGGTHQWERAISADDVAKFETVLKAHLPDEAQRNWIKFGRQDIAKQ